MVGRVGFGVAIVILPGADWCWVTPAPAAAYKSSEGFERIVEVSNSAAAFPLEPCKLKDVKGVVWCCLLIKLIFDVED